MKFSEPQIEVIQSRKPLILNMAGQRSGKSHIIGFKSGYYIRNFPRMRGMIAANTYKQLSQSTLVAARKVWESSWGITEYDPKRNPDGVYVVNKQPPPHFTRFESYDRYDGIVSFKNGGLIYIASLDNYEVHDGKELGWAELDETKDTKEEALTAVILGRLSQPGLYYMPNDPDREIVYSENPEEDWVPFNPCTINTSPAVGVVDWLIDLFRLAEFEEEILPKITDPEDYFFKEVDNKAIVIYSTYHNARNLPKNYISNRLQSLTPDMGLKFVYGYPFSKTGGEYFDLFDRLRHTGYVPYLDKPAVHLTFDFNVRPYMTLICSQIIQVERYVMEIGEGNYSVFTEPQVGTKPVMFWQIRFFKEYCLTSPLNSVEGVCGAFLADFGPKLKANGQDLFFYGDASGNSQIPGQGSRTNFKDVAIALSGYIFSGSNRTMRYNPSVLQRRSFIQNIFKGGVVPIEIIIDRENCPNTVKDFQFLKLGKDGKLKELVKDPVSGATYQKYGHCTDAIEYETIVLFPEEFKR